MKVEMTYDIKSIIERMNANHRAGKLSMWTVYDHPTDYPNSFVARLHEADAQGSQPTIIAIISQDIEELRKILRLQFHLTPLTRDPNDDAKIVETWI
jgi:hypothetical protein